MATVAFGILGAGLGPVGGAVGSLVGSIIDSQFIIPALFPVDPVHGPRLSEFKLQTQDEGSAGNLVTGTGARVAGTIIWVGNLIEEKKTDRAGGKGGGGAKVTTYEYFVDIAIAHSVNRTIQVKKISAEGKPIYDSSPNINYSSTLISVTIEGSGAKRRMRLNSPSGGPDLGKLMAGIDVTISGFSNGANNGTFRCVSSKKNADGSSFAILKNASCVAEAAGATAVIAQVLPLFDQSKVFALTFYDGSEGQAADPIIESYKGAGLVPGFRGVSYVVAQHFALKDYGNRIPNLAFIVESYYGADLPTTIDFLMSRAGLEASWYDTTALSGANDGYAVAGPQPTSQMLQPLLIYGDVLEQESAGTIRLFHRSDPTIIDVKEGDLAAYPDGDQPESRPLEVTDAPEAEQLAELTVKFLDKDKDGNTGAIAARRDGNLTDGTATFDIPIMMTGGNAIATARRLLWLGIMSGKTFRLTLPPKYYGVQENDVLRVPTAGNVYLLLVQKVDVGHNWVLALDCILWDKHVLTQSEEYDAPEEQIVVQEILPVAEGRVSEWPPLAPGSGNPVSNPEISIAGFIEDDDGLYPGVIILVSPDDDEYDDFGTIDVESTAGFTTSGEGGEAVLNGTGIDPAYWDEVSTVDVYLQNGTLESRDAIDVLNGANRGAFGNGEIIGFRDAELVGPKTWRLSGLLRGLRDTADKMTTHEGEEDFVYLNAGGVQIPVNPAWIGQTRYFKFACPGADVDDLTAVPHTITGGSLKPFAPCDLQAAWDASGNVTLSWKRRSREVGRLFSPTQPALLEEGEYYDAAVYYPAGGGGTLVQSWTDLTEPTVSFPSGEHGAIPEGDPFELRVWQKTGHEGVGLGRGKVASATV